MAGDLIDTILAGDVDLAATGERFACPIQSLLIEPSLDGHEQTVLQALAMPSALAIICDPNTHDVLGRRLAKALRSAQVTVLEAPKADDATAEQLTYLTRHAEALIAVGSGTLNDLAKYVSHRRRRPYAVFATAPSMNGYVTATASISRGGEKLSLPAAPPRGAFFDLEILAQAPGRLIRAGVGDSLCRSTAECDWQLAHQLCTSPFLETPFQIQRDDEARLLDQVGDLDKGDLSAIEALTRLLVLGGLGMLIAGSSQPGSQGEHLISHYVDMLHRPHPGSLHGEQIGLATRTMARLQHSVLSR
ncbi:MAG: sn-glycerol-1-phosphate dehydrogenase, partial [Rhizobiales bacterium]|nr:sn-glycerol-1-phosphate dehydrogenase [Hyphomicrobiales bacterium]